MPGVIYHIATAEDWTRGQSGGSYRPAAFDRDGFIHCSTADQVHHVANTYLRGMSGLLLLRIDTQRLTGDLRYEDSHGDGRHFPHIYGDLNIDAVIDARALAPLVDGTIVVPADVSPAPAS